MQVKPLATAAITCVGRRACLQCRLTTLGLCCSTHCSTRLIGLSPNWLHPHTCAGANSITGVRLTRGPQTMGTNDSDNIKATSQDWRVAPREGRLEVKLLGSQTWGPVRYVDYGAARVACRQLGYKGGAVRQEATTLYGHTALRPVLQFLECQGSEKSLSECHFTRPTSYNPGGGDFTGVACTGT